MELFDDEGVSGPQWKLDKFVMHGHSFVTQGTYRWETWLKGVQKLNWFELSGVMEHAQYEKILDAIFAMYERFGLTGEREEEPEEHYIYVRF